MTTVKQQGAPSRQQGRSQHALGVFYGAMGGLSLSLGGPIVRLMSEETGAWQILTWRSFAFMILMFTLAAWKSGSIAGLLHQVRKIGWMAPPIALAVGFGQITYVLALLNTTVANATFVLGSAPLFTAFAAWLLFGDRLSAKAMIALATAMAGVFLMVSNGLADGKFLGNLYALAAMVCYTAYVLLLRKSRDIDTFAASGLGGMLAAVLAAAMALTAGTAVPDSEGALLSMTSLVIPPVDLGLSLFSGVFQVGAGFAFATLATKLIPPAEVTLLILIEAIMGPLLVWGLVGEVPSSLTLLGGSVVLGSVTAFALIALKEERGRVRV
ncbi:DMT family transporter [Pelagibius sp. Alg239-R121]|uniref:DMT family transporter n=1 Tax=Pelagibius sp. Alg239-R121 TaxID=2993448 RepID=UPI0024A6864D|nr:DMT family transporter [Pelagibius sp. Alg239-R121]